MSAAATTRDLLHTISIQILWLTIVVIIIGSGMLAVALTRGGRRDR